MLSVTFGLLSAFVGLVSAGTKVWDGSFNPFSSPSDFDKWSWATPVGTYQWYIHGTGPTSDYLALSPSYKNPALTSENNGVKMMLSSTATWNSQMERVELIPQTSANLGTGNLFYHFTLGTGTTNPPDSTLEHQILFFESHFTEIKYGVQPNPDHLTWMIGGVGQWSTPLVAGTWYNFAYDIDFSAGTVGLWASTGSAPLTKVVQNKAASTSTNSEDFHVGVLRIVNTPTPEDWYVSGVYIESGPITTAIGSGNSTGGASSVPPSSSSAGTTVAPSSTPVSTTTAPTSTAASGSSSAGTAAQWAQCGGIGWTGATAW
ncbi:hypothetical protein K435DRAFT_750788 [Dendrothele bispora CBS 962.96]|uniref:Glycoside hydrolase 131 catalytic N-terminal domain-containing protein n=1 Tax=Dendrothele bispora (strain CBS 962.96) TaxID=1314807 RepID=A0A4S8ME56_DENBC|nr:hypothetical protein K435DRAFT_750788 [Dendrothele bispora CBS 962.96]